MRIVQSDVEDAVLAAHAIERIATLCSTARGTSIAEGRRFEQLAECVDLRLAQLNTSDIARYVWGMTALGVRDLDKYNRVLSVYAARLDALSPEGNSAVDLATVMWTAACIKNIHGPSNSSMVHRAAELLSGALLRDHPASSSPLYARLYVRVIWSLAEHDIAQVALVRRCLELYFSIQAVDDISVSSAMSLVWSLSRLRYFDRSVVRSLLERITRFVTAESANSEYSEEYRVKFAPHRVQLLEALLVLLEEEGAVGSAVAALARDLAVTLLSNYLTTEEVAGATLPQVGAIVRLLREVRADQLDSPHMSELMESCVARLCNAVTSVCGAEEALAVSGLAYQALCDVCAPTNVRSGSSAPAASDARPLLTRLRRHAPWHRLLGKAAARAGLTGSTDLSSALAVTHALALHGYTHPKEMDRLYTQTHDRLGQLAVQNLYRLTLAMSALCAAFPQSEVTGLAGQAGWRTAQFKEAVAMQMLCRLGQLVHPQQVAEAAIAIVHLAAATSSVEDAQLNGSAIEYAVPSEADRLAALVRQAAGIGPEKVSTTRSPRRMPPHPDWFDKGSPAAVPNRAAAAGTGAGEVEWLPEAQRRAAAGGYTLYSLEEEEGMVSDKSKLAAMVEAAATGRSLEEATAVPTTPAVAKVKLSAEQIRTLETPLLVRFLQAVRSLPPDAFEEGTLAALEEAVAGAVSSGGQPDAGVMTSSGPAAFIQSQLSSVASEPRVARLRSVANILQQGISTGEYSPEAEQLSVEALAFAAAGTETEGETAPEVSYLAGFVEGLLAEHRRLAEDKVGLSREGQTLGSVAKARRLLGNFFRAFV